MAIYDRSYSRWDGDRSLPVRAVSIIAAAGVRRGVERLFRRKLFAVMFILGSYATFLFAFVLLFVKFYVLSNVDQFPSDAVQFFTSSELVEILTANGPILFQYLAKVQSYFVTLLVVMVGAGLVAEDRRTNALELYLSRPLGVGKYVLGKLGTMAFFIAMVTVVPATMLLLWDTALSVDPLARVPDAARLLARLLGAGAVIVLVPSLFVVAVSSMTRRARNAAIVLLATLFLLESVLSQGLRELFQQDAFLLLSPIFNMSQAMAWLLQSTDDLSERLPVWQSFAALGALCVLALAVTLRRTRPVEIVA